jgi:peptidoglycan/LPS O-acetylase OafA/YrhL
MATAATRRERPSQQATARAKTASPGADERFRPDIEGLRAVAVVLVVLFHAGVPRVTGGFIGVDVFFVLSGFLITGLLVREIESRGTVSIPRFYARRSRRLLPLAALVLGATAVASRLIMTPLAFGDVGRDIASAALYVSNWRFAAQQSDYMASSVDKSPVLHFWSLSVEEQFYVFWPVILILLASRRGLIGRIWPRLTARGRALIPLVVIGALSLAASIRLSGTAGPIAYYGLHTRAWELAAGGILAVLAPGLARARRWPALLAGVAGIVIVIASAFVIGPTTVFPGSAALLPVGGTVLVVFAGFRAPGAGVGALLSTAPMRYVGRISYAWYLWHWPCLVFVRIHAGGGTDQGASAAAIAFAVAVSFVLAAISHSVVENPARYSQFLTARSRRALLAGLALSLAATACGVLLVRAAPTFTAVAGINPSGASMTPAAAFAPHPMTPIEALKANPRQMPPCDRQHDDIALGACVLGDPNGSKTVVFFGDSHAAAWSMAMDRLGQVRHWRMLQMSKDGCPFADVGMQHVNYPNATYTQCAQWRQNAFAELAAHPVDMLISIRSSLTIDRVFIDGKALHKTPAQAAYEAGFARSLAAVSHSVGRVIVLADTPFATFNIPNCLAAHPSHEAKCNFSRAGAAHLDARLLQAEYAAGKGRVSFIDMTNVICPGRICNVRTPGGLIIYRDSNHLTDLYSAQLWQALGAALDHAQPQPPA